MRVVTAGLVGALAGLTAGVLWLFVGLYGPFLYARLAEPSGLGSTSVGSDSTLLVVVAAYVAGFVWQLRRSRHRTP